MKKQMPNGMKFISEQILLDKMSELVERMKEDYKKSRRFYHDLNHNHILYSGMMYQTENNNLRMTFYNLSYQVPFLNGVATAEAWVNPETFDYKIIFKPEKKIVSRDELDETTRLHFDGMIAHTLHTYVYTEYTASVQLMERRTQEMVFKKCMSDDLTIDLV